MKYTAEEVREAAKTDEHPIPLRVRSMLDAYADSIERAQVEVTDGWVLVPVEPTEAMQTAHHIYGDTSDWWSAVIAAVPSAPEAASYCDASQERCKACGRATRAVCDGLDGNGLGCTNAPSIDLAAVRKVIANHRSEAAKLSHDPESRDYLCEQADKLEAAIKGVE